MAEPKARELGELVDVGEQRVVELRVLEVQLDDLIGGREQHGHVLVDDARSGGVDAHDEMRIGLRHLPHEEARAIQAIDERRVGTDVGRGGLVLRRARREAELGREQRLDLGLDADLGDRLRVRRARIDPPAHDLDLIVGQRRLALGRHELLVVVRQADPAVELAHVRLARGDHAARVAALEQRLVRRHVEPVLALVRVVARHAAALEHRVHDVEERVGRGEARRPRPHLDAEQRAQRARRVLEQERRAVREVAAEMAGDRDERYRDDPRRDVDSFI